MPTRLPSGVQVHGPAAVPPPVRITWPVAAASRAEQRMAFPAGRSRAAQALEDGDQIFVYTTRCCFRNPTRDLGRVVGRARVASPVRVLEEPVVFGERSFTEECRLEVSALARFREDLVLRDDRKVHRAAAAELRAAARPTEVLGDLLPRRRR